MFKNDFIKRNIVTTQTPPWEVAEFEVYAGAEHPHIPQIRTLSFVLLSSYEIFFIYFLLIKYLHKWYRQCNIILSQ